MRTSNKILLSVFLFIILVTVAIQVALYAKYRNGDFIIEGRNSTNFTKHSLEGIHTIYLGGADNVEIRYADTPRVEIQNDPEAKYANIWTTGDTLKINSSIRNYTIVVIYLKDTANIVAASSRITLKGSADSTKALSYKLNLIDDANLLIDNEYVSKETVHYFKAINLVAKKSHVVLNGGARIQSLSLALTESHVIDQGSAIGEMSAIADDNSSIFLRGANLKKLKLP